METLLIITAAALWGCCAGLLTPRAAHRPSVPPQKAWRTACPAGHSITGVGNRWLGRARCGDGYGPSTPVVATIKAVVCAVLATAIEARPELGVWLLLAPVGVLLGTVDFAAHRLPDVLTRSLAAARRPAT